MDDLYHWGLKKGEEKEKHKYVARVEIGKPKQKYRYFYSKEEYASYLKENGISDKDKGSLLDGIKSLINPSKLTETGKDFANKFLKNTKQLPDKSEKWMDSGKEQVKKFFKDTSEDIQKKADEVLNRLKNEGKKICADYTAEQTMKYSEVDKKIGVSNSAEILAKTFVKNAVEAFKGGSVKIYDKVSKLKDLPKKVDKYSDKEDQAVINPDYDPKVYANSMNCAYCTAAYELRKRGYDVEAAPANTLTYNTIDEIASWYKDPDLYHFDTNAARSKDIENEMLKMGEGARGQYCVYWGQGGGHSMVWEVKNNKVIVKDCQTNRVVDIEEYLPYISEGYFFRTDNLELNDRITKAVRQRTKRMVR